MNFTTQTMRIRHMVRADLDRVIEIAQSLKDAPHWPLSAYLTALDENSVPLRVNLVAEDPETGAVTGFAVACLVGPQAELETIAVAAEGQRRGVARRLLAALAVELKRLRVREVTLEVRASNHPALALYRSLGFRETGRRPRYYIDPVEDAVLLSFGLE
jgi:ribosomal-protein-alanine acetyltransferase